VSRPRVAVGSRVFAERLICASMFTTSPEESGGVRGSAPMLIRVCRIQQRPVIRMQRGHGQQRIQTNKSALLPLTMRGDGLRLLFVNRFLRRETGCSRLNRLETRLMFPLFGREVTRAFHLVLTLFRRSAPLQRARASTNHGQRRNVPAANARTDWPSMSWPKAPTTV
jgi:hypothetical protein